MRIAADTNILLRASVADDPKQSTVAAEALRSAELIAVSLTCLAEFVWVLSRFYKRRPEEIVGAVRVLIDDPKVIVDRPAVEAGLETLRAGGDFADGVIAFDGRRMGGDVFVSFDRQAVRHIESSGGKARLLR
jgi:predicted nucleic-acid-binding protein